MNKNNYNEGLGTVYERFMLNDYWYKLLKKTEIKTVLECPFYGMSGLTGINSIYFAKNDCEVTLIDNKNEYIEEAKFLWKDIGIEDKLSTQILNFGENILYKDRYFDFVWNFAALWHWKKTDLLINELCRVSKKYIYIAMPNNKQVGYFMRKYWLDKEFFTLVDESWMNLDKTKNILENNGFKIVDRGVLDVPPWPDTCMPIKDLLAKIGINIKQSNDINTSWNWDIMSFFKDEDLDLKNRVNKYTFIEYLPISWKLKQIWAHHRYILAKRED